MSARIERGLLKHGRPLTTCRFSMVPVLEMVAARTTVPLTRIACPIGDKWASSCGSEAPLNRGGDAHRGLDFDRTTGWAAWPGKLWPGPLEPLESVESAAVSTCNGGSGSDQSTMKWGILGGAKIWPSLISVGAVVAWPC